MARIPAPALAWSRPQLEVRDLELVLALAGAGTTKAAAGALHITQSAVSRALALAEERLGVRLFERGPRGLAPTEAGARLVDGAARALEQLRELERRVISPAVAPTRIRLVAECYTAYRWVPSAMADLRTWARDLEVEVAMEHTGDPVGALRRREIDVALLTTARLERSDVAVQGLCEQPLLSDEVVFVLARSHPLARREALTPADLESTTLITANAPPAELEWFRRSVFGRRRPRIPSMRLPLTEAIIDAARAGMGVAVVSEWMASGYLAGGGLTIKRLGTGALRRPWRIAYHRGIEAVARQLIDVLGSAHPRLRVAGG